MKRQISRKTNGDARKTPTSSASLKSTMKASTGEVKTISGLPMPTSCCASSHARDERARHQREQILAEDDRRRRCRRGRAIAELRRQVRSSSRCARNGMRFSSPASSSAAGGRRVRGQLRGHLGLLVELGDGVRQRGVGGGAGGARRRVGSRARRPAPAAMPSSRFGGGICIAPAAAAAAARRAAPTAARAAAFLTSSSISS